MRVTDAFAVGATTVWDPNEIAEPMFVEKQRPRRADASCLDEAGSLISESD